MAGAIERISELSSDQIKQFSKPQLFDFMTSALECLKEERAEHMKANNEERAQLRADFHALNITMNTVSEDVNKMRSELGETNAKVVNIDTRLTNVETKIVPFDEGLMDSVESLQEQVASL